MNDKGELLQKKCGNESGWFSVLGRLFDERLPIIKGMFVELKWKLDLNE